MKCLKKEGFKVFTFFQWFFYSILSVLQVGKKWELHGHFSLKAESCSKTPSITYFGGEYKGLQLSQHNKKCITPIEFWMENKIINNTKNWKQTSCFSSLCYLNKGDWISPTNWAHLYTPKNTLGNWVTSRKHWHKYVPLETLFYEYLWITWKKLVGQEGT